MAGVQRLAQPHLQLAGLVLAGCLLAPFAWGDEPGSRAPPAPIQADPALRAVFEGHGETALTPSTRAWTATSEGFAYAAVLAKDPVRGQAAMLCRAGLVKARYPEAPQVTLSGAGGDLFRQAFFRLSVEHARIGRVETVLEDELSTGRLRVCRAPVDQVQRLSQAQAERLAAQAAYDTAKTLLTRGQPDAAQEALSLARRSPRVRPAATALLIPVQARDASERAQALAEDELDLQQVEDADALVFLASHWLAQGRWEAAAAVFERCLAVAPRHEICLDGLARAQSEAARQARQEALSYDEMVKP